MENYGARDATTLVGEITRGWELTRMLEQSVDQSLPVDLRSLVQGILVSWEKAMALVKVGSESPVAQPIVESPRSATDSPQSGGCDWDVSKKRKVMHKWTAQMRVCSGAVLEGAIEDGYSWRKYGQKDILGATYPRGYYRCTHRNTQGCMATKQVQRSDDNPTIFDVTYRGEHTCHKEQPPALASPLAEHCLSTGRADLTIERETSNEGLDLASFYFPSMDSQGFAGSNLFTTPGTPESGYHPPSPFHTSGLGNGTQSNLSEVVLASMPTNSLIGDLDFGLEHVEFDTSFLDPCFFS